MKTILLPWPVNLSPSTTASMKSCPLLRRKCWLTLLQNWKTVVGKQREPLLTTQVQHCKLPRAETPVPASVRSIMPCLTTSEATCRWCALWRTDGEGYYKTHAIVFTSLLISNLIRTSMWTRRSVRTSNWDLGGEWEAGIFPTSLQSTKSCWLVC